MESATIRQGDSLVWLARPNALEANEIPASWSCMAGLYTQYGQEQIASFAVADKHTLDGVEYFLVALTRLQTKTVPPGAYIESIDILNETLTPMYSQESSINVLVEAQRLARD